MRSHSGLHDLHIVLMVSTFLKQMGLVLSRVKLMIPEHGEDRPKIASVINETPVRIFVNDDIRIFEDNRNIHDTAIRNVGSSIRE